MKLPLALKNQLEESERKLEKLLEKLGWERKDLESAAEKAARLRLRPRPHSTACRTGGADSNGRIYHV